MRRAGLLSSEMRPFSYGPPDTPHVSRGERERQRFCCRGRSELAPGSMPRCLRLDRHPSACTTWSIQRTHPLDLRSRRFHPIGVVVVRKPFCACPREGRSRVHAFSWMAAFRRNFSRRCLRVFVTTLRSVRFYKRKAARMLFISRPSLFFRIRACWLFLALFARSASGQTPMMTRVTVSQKDSFVKSL